MRHLVIVHPPLLRCIALHQKCLVATTNCCVTGSKTAAAYYCQQSLCVLMMQKPLLDAHQASYTQHCAVCKTYQIKDGVNTEIERHLKKKLCTDPTPWLHKSTLGIFCEGLRIEMHAALLARRLLPPLSARSLPCETPARQIRFLQDPLLTRSHPRMTNNIFCRYFQGLLCSLSLRKPILCNKQVVWQFDGILYISSYCHILASRNRCVRIISLFGYARVSKSSQSSVVAR